jgi:hypothetical protein
MTVLNIFAFAPPIIMFIDDLLFIFAWCVYLQHIRSKSGEAVNLFFTTQIAVRSDPERKLMNERQVLTRKSTVPAINVAILGPQHEMRLDRPRAFFLCPADTKTLPTFLEINADTQIAFAHHLKNLRRFEIKRQPTINSFAKS